MHRLLFTTACAKLIILPFSPPPLPIGNTVEIKILIEHQPIYIELYNRLPNYVGYILLQDSNHKGKDNNNMIKPPEILILRSPLEFEQMECSQGAREIRRRRGGEEDDEKEDQDDKVSEFDPASRAEEIIMVPVSPRSIGTIVRDR